MARVNSTGKETGSNFSPANGTGLAVRTAMKDIFESLRTLNSAAGDPTGAENLAAYQLHINTTDDLLKIRNGANSAFITVGDVTETNLGLLPRTGGSSAPMTGQFLAHNSGSSEGTPDISFAVDTDTGLFRSAANTLAISCAGTRQFTFDQTLFESKSDITLEKTGTDAALQLRTNSNSNNAIVDLSSDNTTLGLDFGLRLIRSGGVDGFSKLHHRSTSATANNLIIESQAKSSGGIVLQTGGDCTTTPETVSKSRFAVSHDGTTLVGEAIRIAQDPVTISGNVGSGIKMCGPATASTEYDGFGMSINAKDIVGIFNRTNTTGVVVEFKYNGSVVGSVSTNGSATTYNQSSDYRLKQDITNIDSAITKIKTLRPVTFRWKNNVEIGYDSGFIAHEVQETGHYNHLVTGVKDGTRTSHSNSEENEPDYQGVDYSKFTPMLVAALQEAVAKIETLETKVAALEGA
jgi:hypothetical protein